MHLHRLMLAVAVPHAAFGVLEVVHDQNEVFQEPLDWVVEVCFAAAMLGAGLALRAMARRAGGVTRAAWHTAAAGSVAVGAAATATAVAGEEVLDPVLAVGLLAVLLGYLAALVLDLRGHVLPRRAGVVLFVSLLGSLLLEPTGAGGLVLAAGWLGLARLAAEPGDDVPSSARVEQPAG